MIVASLLVTVPVLSRGSASLADAVSEYRSTVLADNPVSYWPLDESSGTTAADAEGRNNGSISGGVTLGVPGPIAGQTAMSFDGGNCTGIDVGQDPASLAPQNLSVEGWVRTASG